MDTTSSNSKNYIVWAVIVLVILIGGYLAYRTFVQKPAADAANQAAAAASIPPDQVQAQDVTVGTGLEAKAGDTVSVLYEGRFTDGTVFDSSAAHNNEPLTFVLGDPNSPIVPIVGFQIGVNGMKEGGERLLAIPPALGYGAEDVKDGNGTVVIPANTTLVFRVSLVKVVAGTSTPTQE